MMPLYAFLKSLSPASRMIAVGVVLLFCADLWMQVEFAAMGDKGWLLFAADEWLAGKKLYVDIFEINPPLILWLYVVPAWLAYHIPALRDYQGLAISAITTALVSVWLGSRLIKAHPAFAGDAKKQLTFALVLAGIFLYLTPAMFFGDREHIMLVLTFPYILRFAPSLARTHVSLRLRTFIGLLAAVGFCIKPQAALVFLLLQAVYLLNGRTLKTLLNLENVIIILLGCVYVVAIGVLTPDYFHTVIPMALATYSDFNNAHDRHFMLAMIACTVALPLYKFQPRFVTPYRADMYYFLALPLLYLAYAYTGNGWGYTYQPIFSTLAFLTVWLTWDYDWLRREHTEQGRNSRAFVIGWRCCMVSLGMSVFSYSYVLVVSLLSPASDGALENTGNAPFVQYMQKNSITSFGLMSGEFTRWPQISRAAGAAWDTRFNHLWMVPALTGSRGASLGWVREYVGNAYAQDLNHHRPGIIFVDNSDIFFTTAHHVDLVGLWQEIPAFAKEWRHYRWQSTLDFCSSDAGHMAGQKVGCRYDIYRRMDNP